MSKRQYAWDVFKNGKWIDRVFLNPGMRPAEVKAALVEHDGYDPDITVWCVRRGDG